MDQLIKPTEPPESDEPNEGFQIPAWAWGAGAGAAVLVSGVAVSTYHFVARRFRLARARQDVLNIVHAEAETPRGDGLSGISLAAQATQSGEASSPFDNVPPPPSTSPFIDNQPPVSSRDQKPTRTTLPKKGEVIV